MIIILLILWMSFKKEKCHNEERQLMEQIDKIQSLNSYASRIKRDIDRLEMKKQKFEKIMKNLTDIRKKFHDDLQKYQQKLEDKNL